MDKYFTILRSILKTKTFQESGISFVGTFITGILGVVFYILMARLLEPESYGAFTVTLAVMTLIASIANVGTDTGVIRFVSQYVKTDKVKSYQFLKLALKIKLIAGITLVFLGLLLAPSLAKLIFDKPELTNLLRLSFIGVSGLLLFSFGSASLQAFSRFFVWSFVSVGSNATRLVVVLVLLAFGYLNLVNAIWSFIAVLFLWFFVSQLFLPSYIKVKGENKLIQQFFKYNVWVATFTLLAAIGSRVDTFIIARSLTLTEVGIYGVAISLSGFVSQIVMAYATVLAPKLSSMQKPEFLVYFKKVQLFAILLALLGLLVGVPLGYVLIPLLYGPIYQASVFPFYILLVSQAIFLIATPIHASVMYYFAYPKLFVYITAANVLIVTVGGVFLTSKMGFVGTATAVLLGMVSNLVLPSLWVYLKLKD